MAAQSNRIIKLQDGTSIPSCKTEVQTRIRCPVDLRNESRTLEARGTKNSNRKRERKRGTKFRSEIEQKNKNQ